MKKYPFARGLIGMFFNLSASQTPLESDGGNKIKAITQSYAKKTRRTTKKIFVKLCGSLRSFVVQLYFYLSQLGLDDYRSNVSSQGKSLGLHRNILAGIFFVTSVLLPASLYAQNYSTTIHKTVQFYQAQNSKNELRVYNINGPVTVEGYKGDEIQVTGVEKINGSTKQINRAKKELQVKVKQLGDTVLVYLDAPFIRLNHANGHFSYNVHRNNDGNKYDFYFDIHIRVPRQAAIHASTINKGTVSIKNTAGDIYASNINGDLNLLHIAGKTEAKTINGNITATYDKNPDKSSKYHTINGNIEVYYPPDLSADIGFKSMHGDLYTNFNPIKRLKERLHSHRQNGKTRYRLGRFTRIRIGAGGPAYTFKVLNGDVTIKKNQS